MLFPLRKGPAASDSSVRPADLLLACHARIRRFVRLAVDIAAVTAAPPAEVSDAALRLIRYHRIALPLHEADEELSVHPRLEAASPPDAVRAALAATVEEHRRIDEVVAELLVGWSAITQDPGSLPQYAGALTAHAAALAALWELHLAREEALIFPAIALLLPPGTESAILTEMKARRATSLEGAAAPPLPARGPGQP